MKRLRQLQIANNELVDAEERIRTQVKTVQHSENLVADWMRKCWVHEENAIKGRSEMTKCRAELLEMSKKMKKMQREANEKEKVKAATARMCAKHIAELKRLTAKEQKRASEVIEVSPGKAIIDMAPARPETKTLVNAVTTINLAPISAIATKPSKEEKKPTEVYQFGSITALLDAARALPQTMTLMGATTTTNIPPVMSEATKSSKEEKAAKLVSEMGPATAIIDISPTPTPSPSETKTLVGAVTTTSVFPPTSAATEPLEGSTGSAPTPPTISGRKIKKPVSQLNRPGAAAVAAALPVPVAVTRTPSEEVHLLIQMVEMAKAAQTKAQTKAALYDIIQQLSYLASVCDFDDQDFVEFALETLASISSDENPGNSILPPFLREMAGSLCQEVRGRAEKADDEGDVEMEGNDDDGEEDAGGDEADEDGEGGAGDARDEDDSDAEVQMTWEEEYEGLNNLSLDIPV